MIATITKMGTKANAHPATKASTCFSSIEKFRTIRAADHSEAKVRWRSIEARLNERK
jgi:hypothetical protein